MQSSKNSFDNFKSITGIGPAREKWLQETFNIHTYQELAKLTTSQIEQKLKEEGKIVSRKSIESWIEQARELIPDVPTNKQVEEEGVAKELAEKFGSSGFQNGWRPFASFLVYFQSRAKEKGHLDYQTLVHYMEQDREASWPGIKAKELTNWMLDNIGEIVELPEGEEEDLSESLQRSKTPAEIKINQVRIYQPVSDHLPAHQIIAGKTEEEVVSDRPFRFVVDFDLKGKAAKQVTEQGIKCLARCYKYDKGTKNSALMAESPWQKLEAGKLKYSFDIPETSLSKGDYRIWLMVTTLQTDILKPGFLELTAFRVE